MDSGPFVAVAGAYAGVFVLWRLWDWFTREVGRWN